MALKVYLGNKLLYLRKPEDQTESLVIPERAVYVDNLEEDNLAAFLDVVQSSESIGAGIIEGDPEESLNALKKHFSFIEAAGGLIVNEKGEVLMIFRRGKWDLPKGKLDDNETLEACAVREVEEETGVAATITGPLTITYHTYMQEREAILKISHWFSMRAEGNAELNPQTEEDIEKCEWVKKENISYYFDGAHASIQDVLKKGLQLQPA